MELDDLKTAWKQIPEEKYDQNKIFKMLKNKSSNIIQWFFKFTLLELFLILTFTITPLIKGNIATNLTQTEPLHNSPLYTIGSFIILFTTLAFLAYSYITSKKININESIKELMDQIISYRKAVNYFIFFIVLTVLVISIPYYFELGKSIYINQSIINHDIEKAELYGYITVSIAIIFIIIITTIYYGFIHWFFLRKLTKNVKELKEITE